MKKSILLLSGLISILSLASCDNPNNKPNEEETLNSTSYYIGVNVKDLATMGHSVGGHMIVLNGDKTLDIHSGMKASMAGSSAYPFKGTYELNNDELVMSYKAVKKEETEYTVEKTTIVNNDMFRAFLRTNGGMPNDETDPNRPGLNYYKLEGYEKSSKIDTVYISSKVIDNEVYAYLLEVTWDAKCTFVYRAGQKHDVLKGSYEFKMGEGNESNYIALNLEGNEQRVSLSNPKLGFELSNISLPALEAVEVITPDI